LFYFFLLGLVWCWFVICWEVFFFAMWVVFFVAFVWCFLVCLFCFLGVCGFVVGDGFCVFGCGVLVLILFVGGNLGCVCSWFC